MICGINPLIPDSSDGRRKSRSYTTRFLRTISITTGATLLIVVLFLSLGKIRLPQAGRTLLVAFIYCVLISVPSIALLTRVSFKYSERFPRLIVFIQALVLVSTAVAGSFAAGLVFQVTGLVPRGWYWIELRGVLPFSVVISLMFGMSMITFETLRYKLQATALELRTHQVEQERAYKLLAEAKLSALESRIHPHFLFNTLNSIAALIPRDPQLAEDTVGKLASLLRFSLNANQSGLVPLSQELKIVRDYLEIEKTRFGPRLIYQIDSPAALNDVKVPPLSLQSLVENAVKHVAAKRQHGATIQVAATEDSGRVRLEVIDDGPGFSLESITPEHGLGNLIARLELLFGADGRLEVTRKQEMTAVCLSFPASLEP